MSDAIPCAGAIVFDGSSRLLLVKRANEPGAGLWSVPGGRCLSGESAAAACVREVAEETGLIVRVVRLVGSVLRPGPAGVRYAIDDFLCEVLDGVLRAGDDADEAHWVPPADLVRLPLVPGLEAALRDWQLWPVED
jgi:8-oxo-dGTP diphosphatase